MAKLYDVAHFCSWNGYTEDMRSYLGVDTSSWTNSEFWSPHGANLLYGPAKKSRIQIICDHGWYSDAQFSKNYNAVARIRELIADGAKPDIKDANGCSALLVCARNDFEQNLEIIKVLLDAGADVNQANGIYNFTALILSAANGHIEIVRELIRRGADVNLPSKGGRMAIEYAAGSGHMDVVKELFAAGAVINAEIFDDIIKGGYMPLLKYILTIAPPAQDAVFDAVYHKQASMIRVLAKAGADMNFKFPMHMAIQEHNNKCLLALCVNCANLNILDESNDSPLREAINEGNYEAIKILVDHKADINDVMDSRPLIHWAIDMFRSYPEEKRKKCLLAMIEAAPNFKLLNQEGNTAAEHAEDRGMPEIVTLIKRAEMKQRFLKGKK